MNEDDVIVGTGGGDNGGGLDIDQGLGGGTAIRDVEGNEITDDNEPALRVHTPGTREGVSPVDAARGEIETSAHLRRDR